MGVEGETPNFLKQVREVAENYDSDREYSLDFSDEQLFYIAEIIYKKYSFKEEHGYDSDKEKNIYCSMFEKLKDANILAYENQPPQVELTKGQIYLIDEALDDNVWEDRSRETANKEISTMMHREMHIQDRAGYNS